MKTSWVARTSCAEAVGRSLWATETKSPGTTGSRSEADRFVILTSGFPKKPCRDPFCCLNAHNWAELHIQQTEPRFEYNYTTTAVNTDKRVDGAYIYRGEAQNDAWCNLYNSEADGPTGVPCSEVRQCVDRLEPNAGLMGVMKHTKGMSVQMARVNRLARLEETAAEDAEEPTEEEVGEDMEDSYDTVEIVRPRSFSYVPKLSGGFAVFLAVLAFLNRMSRS